MRSVEDARLLVKDLELDAKLRGRWFTSYPTNNAGTDSTPQLTFVNGNASITSNGVGVLVVTGELTLNTDRTFEGLILLLGGGTLRQTGGDTKVEGQIIIARFGSTGSFLGPIINMSGGKAEFKIDTERVQAGLATINMGIQAVREK